MAIWLASAAWSTQRESTATADLPKVQKHEIFLWIQWSDRV